MIAPDWLRFDLLLLTVALAFLCAGLCELAIWTWRGICALCSTLLDACAENLE
jgi:hypothetical protein